MTQRCQTQLDQFVCIHDTEMSNPIRTVGYLMPGKIEVSETLTQRSRMAPGGASGDPTSKRTARSFNGFDFTRHQNLNCSNHV